MSSTTKSNAAMNERKACRFESCVNRLVDGELDAGHATDVENHLAECLPCDEQAKLLRAMKASLRRRGAERAPDALRAKLSLVIAREASSSDKASDERPSIEGLTPAMPAVTSSASSPAGMSPAGMSPAGMSSASMSSASMSSASMAVFSSAPARESLVGGAHDRAHRQAVRSAFLEGGRGSRVAYGVGALAVAAGVALAVVGERYGDSTGLVAGDGEDAASSTTRSAGIDDGRSADRRASARRDDKATRPARQPEWANVGDSRVSSKVYGEGPSGVDASGVPVPGTGLVPVVDAPLASNPMGSTRVPLVDMPQAGRVNFDTLLDDLVALHANPLPPETTDPEDMRKYDALVGVKVRRPTLRPYAASFRGARLHAMRDAQRTAMLQYILGNGHHVTVYVFNPRDVQMGTTHMQPRVVREEPIYVGSVRGYSVAAAERRGVGYALATDLDTDDSVKMVASSLP